MVMSALGENLKDLTHASGIENSPSTTTATICCCEDCVSNHHDTRIISYHHNVQVRKKQVQIVAGKVNWGAAPCFRLQCGCAPALRWRETPHFPAFHEQSMLNTIPCEKPIYHRHEKLISLESKRDNGQNHPRRGQGASATAATSSSSIHTLQNTASFKIDAKFYQKTDFTI